MKELHGHLANRVVHPTEHVALPEFTIVSMFSGCGGMDFGFLGGFEVFGRRYDGLPFRIVWANEHNVKACATYRRNISKDIFCGDVGMRSNRCPPRRTCSSAVFLAKIFQ
jgi:hypothetical protein